MNAFDNPINDLMWSGFLSFTLGDARFREGFTADTSRKFMPAPRNGLEAMIDNATGINKQEVEHFMAWVTVRHWGLPYAPAKFRERVLEMRAAGLLPWMTDADVNPVVEDEEAVVEVPAKETR